MFGRNAIYVIYLTVEGVLLPSTLNRKTFFLSDHLNRLGALLMPFENVQVVLNSSWVAQYGYRMVLGHLPVALKSRVVGATVPGNKMLGPSPASERSSRRSLLERDYLRRRPDEVLVVDCDVRCVPTQLQERAFIVAEGLWRAQDHTWASLADRLKVPD